MNQYYYIILWLSINIIIWGISALCGITSLAWHLVILLFINGAGLGYVIWRAWNTISQGHALSHALQEQAESQAGKQLEIAVLKESMNTAIDALKTSNLRGKAALYALPWFIVIGPAAAGKSTLLRNSGLPFSFTQEEDISVKGFGGTRNCDWWFSNQAIILDTAGRYTTETHDHDEWMAFLGLLKKYRPRQPINGVIIAIDIMDVLHNVEAPLNKHIQIIRKRIEELTQQFGVAFPVFLIFTKCDLLPGFEAFFSMLNDHERNDVWGLHFFDSDAVVSEKINALARCLFAQRLRKLGIVRNSVLQQAVYDFPDRFHVALEKVRDFLDKLSQHNPYQNTPKICGVYFTSAEQEVEGAEHSSKPYFIKEVFTKVIFVHSAQRTPSRWRNNKWIKSIGVVSAASCLGIYLVGLQAAFNRNVDVLKRGEGIATQLMQNVTGEEAFPIHSLQAVYDFWDALHAQKASLPFYARLGLYRGNRLLPVLSHTIASVMQYHFMQSVGAVLMRRLHSYTQQNKPEAVRGPYYVALKSYLMLCYPKHIHAHDAVLLVPYWEEVLRGAHGMRNDKLAGLVHIYLEQLAQYPETLLVVKPFTPDVQLIKQARGQLYLPDDAKNLFAGLQIEMQLASPSLSVDAILQGKYATLFTNQRTLSVMYTQEAWKRVVQPALKDIATESQWGDWVIHGDHKISRQKALLSQLSHLYFEAYDKAWIAFLSSVQFRPFASLQDAAQKLAIIAQPSGPIEHLLDNVPIFDSRKIQGLSTYLREIANLQSDIERLTLLPDVDQVAQQYAEQILSGRGANLTLYRSSVSVSMFLENIEDMAVRRALQSVLLSPVREAWRAVVNQAVKGIEIEWQNQIMSVYSQMGEHKFLLATNFFHPLHGILWQFVTTVLKPYLYYDKTGWRAQTWLGVGAGFSQDFLQNLNKAYIIGRHLFTQASDVPRLDFQVYPMPTPGIRKIILSINDVEYVYSNGPQAWHGMHWSADRPLQDTRLEVITASGRRVTVFSGHGAWSIFKWMQAAEVRALSDQTYNLSWSLGKKYRFKKIALLLRTQYSQDVLLPLLWHPVHLPHHLLGLSEGDFYV